MQDLCMKPQFPEQEQLKCPRCDSGNTKFCYYNNYNLSQPRHLCKNCRRYWTKGGTLRNIPVGGSSRKNGKRPSNPKRQKPDPGPVRNQALYAPQSQCVSIRNSVSDHDPTRMYTLSVEPDRKTTHITGRFSSLLATSTQFGSLLDGLNANGSAPEMVQLSDFTEDLNVASSGLESGSGLNRVLDEHGNNGSESYLLESGESSFWGGGNGWPDLDIYTPSSSFQ